MAMMLFFSRRDRCTLSPLLSSRLSLSVFLSRFGLLWGIYFLEWGVGGFLFVCVCWRGSGGGVVYLMCLPKEVKPHTILPLGSLHADPVCWPPGSSYAAIGWRALRWLQPYSWRIHASLSRAASTWWPGDWLSFSG